MARLRDVTKVTKTHQTIKIRERFPYMHIREIACVERIHGLMTTGDAVSWRTYEMFTKVTKKHQNISICGRFPYMHICDITCIERIHGTMTTGDPPPAQDPNARPRYVQARSQLAIPMHVPRYGFSFLISCCVYHCPAMPCLTVYAHSIHCRITTWCKTTPLRRCGVSFW